LLYINDLQTHSTGHPLWAPITICSPTVVDYWVLIGDN